MSPSSGRAGGLVEVKKMTSCPALLVINFGSTKPLTQPENRDRACPRKVGKTSHRDAAV